MRVYDLHVHASSHFKEYHKRHLDNNPMEVGQFEPLKMYASPTACGGGPPAGVKVEVMTYAADAGASFLF